MKEAPENGKESPHSAHANGMNEVAFMSHSVATPTTWNGIIGQLVNNELESIYKDVIMA